MSGPVPLSPRGAARARLGARGAGAVFECEPPVPEPLARAVAELELDEAVLYRAWELARCAGDLSPEDARACVFLLAACLLNRQQGSTRLPLAPREHLDGLLEALGAAREERDRAFALVGRAEAIPLIGVGDDYAPLVREGDALYLQRMRHLERRVVQALGARLAAGDLPVDPGELQIALEAVLAAPPVLGSPVELTDEQQRAVLTAVRRPMAVLSGGPGTGKTSIVVSVLRVLARLGVPMESVALAAPTGKAANRMEESIKKYLRGISGSAVDAELLAACPEPRTLHRLLGYLPSSDSFRHHGGNPLSERVVIVDECSMIDLGLMDQLVRAVRPEARLVLLGDAEQLPSVEAGAVFRDLVPGDAADDARARGAVRLTRSFRMSPTNPAGRAILEAARVINAGAAPELLDPAAGCLTRAAPDALAFEKVELIASARDDDREAFLDRWFQARLRAPLPEFDRLAGRVYAFENGWFGAEDEAALRRLFEHFEASRILTITREETRGTGAKAINDALHRRAVEGAGVRGELLAGEPVMMLRNDYELGLFNGDQGLVLRVREGGEARLRAVFPLKTGFAAFNLDAIRAHLRLSYAMTVHKSQGSEFECVALVLPKEPLPLLTRELVYTAVTRSRRSVVLVGSEAVLAKAVERRMERFSGVGTELRHSALTGRRHID